MTVRLTIKARIDLQGLIDTCSKIPEMLEAEPGFDLVCEFHGGSISCSTIEDVVSLIRAMIEREKKDRLLSESPRDYT